MAVSILSLLTSVKLFINRPYLSNIAQMQIIGGGYKLPALSIRPSHAASSSGHQIKVASATTELSTGDEAVFYHPVNGPIIAEDYGYPWLFSTQRFVRDLQMADASPDVIAHFLHIKSGGGQAWFLDKAAEAIAACKKPVYAFCEMICCSAAYYLASGAQVIKCYTQNDQVGSIGTMVSFWDETGFWEKYGMKRVEAYATMSDLKNKKVDDLINGSPEQFIKEELDPLCEQFLHQIKISRNLSSLPDDDPVFRGETFCAAIAQEKGLIDGITDIGTAIVEAYEMGITVKNNNNSLNEI